MMGVKTRKNLKNEYIVMAFWKNACKIQTACFTSLFHINNTKNLLLTTALQSGGWVPETSRSFHYWQPAPRWRPLPWLANPSNPAMSPHVEGEKQAPVTLIKQWKKGRERGGETASKGVPTLRKRWLKRQKNCYNALWTTKTRNPGACAYLTNHWPRR